MRIRSSPGADRVNTLRVPITIEKRNKPAQSRVRFRACLILATLLFSEIGVPAAAPCTQVSAQPEVWVTAKVNALVRAARNAFETDNALPVYEKVIDEIAGTIHECKLSEDHSFISRYRNFIEFIEAAGLERRSDHELGFLVPDKQYFAETRQFVGIPDFLLEPAFLKNVSRYETLGRAKSYLKQLNSLRGPGEQLTFFSYKSRHLGTPDNDNSYRRLLIVIPGNAEKGLPDKWVQFGVTDPGKRVRVRNVSVVSAMAAGNSTFNAYFKDYYRTYRSDGSIAVEGRWELGEGDDNCTMCHKSGILPIFPVRGTVSAAEQQALLAVNERFRSYGSARFGGYLDGRKLGPGLSSVRPENRQRRFGFAFEKTPAAKAMICSSCHNSERLGALNWPMDRILIKSYVTGGQMPFGQSLRNRDRQQIYSSLIEEYFAADKHNPGVLKSWLLGVTQ